MPSFAPSARATASVLKHIERVQKARSGRQVAKQHRPLPPSRPSPPTTPPVPRIVPVPAKVAAAMPQQRRLDGTGSRIPGPAVITRTYRPILSFPLATRRPSTPTSSPLPPPLKLKSAIRGPTSLKGKSVHFEDQTWAKAQVRFFPREDSDFGDRPLEGFSSDFYPSGPRPHIKGVAKVCQNPPQFWRHTGTFFEPATTGTRGSDGQTRPDLPTNCAFCTERYALGGFLPHILDDLAALEEYDGGEISAIWWDQSRVWHVCEGCEDEIF